MIHLTNEAIQPMITDALRSFPHECCGFLFGHENGEDRVITSMRVVNNISEEDQRRKFSISGQDYMIAENFATENNLSLLGIYHSHPNHPAIPSEHDRIAAQSFFSYIIISVSENSISAVRSWRLNEESQFEEEQINQPLHPS